MLSFVGLETHFHTVYGHHVEDIFHILFFQKAVADAFADAAEITDVSSWRSGTSCDVMCKYGMQ